MKRFFKKLSDRGSTFVIVITTIGFVGVITSLVLMVTSSGYQTKAIDNQAKNNFYSAEEIIDQIKTGLHNDMSKAIMESYFKTLTTYYNDNFANEDNSNIRKEKLKEVNDKYKINALGDKISRTGFIGMIHDHTKTDDIVSIDVLKGYISSVYENEIGDDKFIIGAAKNESVTADETERITYELDIVDIYAPDGTIEKVEYSIIIKNIGITYVNELGYTNNVYTDIKMTIPDIDLQYIDLDRNLDFVRYGLLAKNNLSMASNATTGIYSSAVIGNFWVGNNLNITGSARFQALSDYGYIGGDMNLNVNGSTSVAPSMSAREYVRNSMFEMNILTGESGYYAGRLEHRYKSQLSGETVKSFYPANELATIENKSGSAKFENKQMNTATGTTKKYNMTETYLAVDDILMNDKTTSGTNTKVTNAINTDVNLLVKNDMLFNVDYARAEINNMYHGYGYSNERLNVNADHNSSIILNNKNCVLNMNLRGLSILGSAFIKTDGTSANDRYAFPYASSDILTGDSLIVRGNQIAYLVPAKYIPTFNTNPVTSDELNSEGVTNVEEFAEKIMEKIENDAGHLMTYFTQNVSAGEPFVKPVLYSYTSQGRANYVVYFYFSFANASLAGDYYKEAVDEHGVKLVSDVTKRTLLGLIPAEINVTIDDMTASTIVGNYIKDLTSNEAGVDGNYEMGDAMEEVEASNITSGQVYSKIVQNMKSFLRKSVPKSIEDEKVDESTGENEILKSFLSRDAVDNIIAWEKFDATETQEVMLEEDYKLNGNNVKIVVTKGDYPINNRVESNKYLIIAQGNVTIADNSYVSGLVISRGNINMGTGVTVESCPKEIEDVFRNAAMYRTHGNRLFSEIFRGYDYDRRIGEEINICDYMIDLNGMFTYQNWSRQ